MAFALLTAFFFNPESLRIKTQRKNFRFPDFIGLMYHLQKMHCFCLKTVHKEWQGWQDLNLRMSQSKCDALPLGYTPIKTMRPLYKDERSKWGG